VSLGSLCACPVTLLQTAGVFDSHFIQANLLSRYSLANMNEHFEARV